MRAKKNSESVLFLSNRTRASAPKPFSSCHCKRRGITENWCWENRLDLRPVRPTQAATSRNSDAFVAKTNSQNVYNESDFVYLLVKIVKVPRTQPEHWYIDSGPFVQMTSLSSCFTTFNKIDSFPMQIGDKSNLVATGQNCAELSIKLGTETTKYLRSSLLYKNMCQLLGASFYCLE